MAPSHYLYRCWNIVNWTKFCEILIRILMFSSGFHSRNVLKALSAKWWPILSRHQFVNTLRLTQNGWYFADDIVKRIFFNVFGFGFKFHWSLFIWVPLTIFQHWICLWIRWWLGTVQAASHYLNQCWLDYRRIHASLGLNELNQFNECLVSIVGTDGLVL